MVPGFRDHELEPAGRRSPVAAPEQVLVVVGHDVVGDRRRDAQVERGLRPSHVDVRVRDAGRDRCHLEAHVGHLVDGEAGGRQPRYRRGTYRRGTEGGRSPFLHKSKERGRNCPARGEISSPSTFTGRAPLRSNRNRRRCPSRLAAWKQPPGDLPRCGRPPPLPAVPAGERPQALVAVSQLLPDAQSLPPRHRDS